MAKGIKYSTTNTFTISDPSYENTTRKFTVKAYSKEFEGDTDQDKINAAEASGLGSEPSDPIEVKFPISTGVTPTNVRTENLTSESVDVLFDAGSAKGLAWIGHRFPVDSTSQDPKDAINMDYDEDKKITLTAEYVDEGSLAGRTIKIAIKEYNEKGQGADDAAKAKWLDTNGRGSELTQFLEIKFPEAEK